MMHLSDYVNEGPPSARLGSLASYLKEDNYKSPIDMYRNGIKGILNYGTPSVLSSSDFMGRLLVLGIVSAAEGYVRALLSACLEICPVSRANVAKKNVNLGGLLWHGTEGFSRGAFEHASFASKEELTKAFKEYLKIDLDNATFSSLLSEFDSVCHLRHGIVHSDGFLPGRNAVQLDIPAYDVPVRIVIGYGQLQEVAAVVNVLIVTINRVVFSEMCKRWAVDWRKRSDWNPDSEEKIFRKIWKLFHSVEEWKTRKGKSKITCGACMADVKAQYGL